MKNQWMLWPAYLVFFLSGVASLIYEISWSRQIGLLFGHTAQAGAIVLVSFFAGMAAGSLIGAKWTRRGNPLCTYGIAELVVASWACVIPVILRLAESHGNELFLNSPSPIVQLMARADFCFLLLLPSSIAIGTTLPLVASYLTSQRRETTESNGCDQISVAYSLNTFGGFLGVTIATFFMLPSVGVCTSSYVAAALSTTCGIVAIVMSRWEVESVSKHGLNTIEAVTRESQTTRIHSNRLETQSNQESVPLLRSKHLQSYSIVALSGFVTMSLQALYLRLFSLVFHNSTYTFGSVVATFIAFLALGAAIASKLRCDHRTLDRTIGNAASLGAISTIGSLLIFRQVSGMDYFSFGSSFVGYMIGVYALVWLVVGFPVSCLGVLLPLTWRRNGNTAIQSEIVGQLTAVNAMFSAVGVATTSFFILPVLGLWKSFVLVASLLCAFALIEYWKNNQQRLAVFVIALFMGLNVLVWGGSFEPRTSQIDRTERNIHSWQSAYGVIDVVQNSETGSLKVRQNLHYRFGETKSATRESRQAHIPLLLHPQPTDVFFMGLGTGLTACGAISHPEVNSITIAELIPEVVEAARLLATENLKCSRSSEGQNPHR